MSTPLPVRRPAIVDAAITMLERDGVDGLTMRDLADHLELRPMTLYYHVPNKAALLTMVISEMGSRIEWTPPTTGTPRERLIAQALDVYTKLAAVTWLPGVLRSGADVGAPPFDLVESFLSTAGELGLSDEAAFGLWRTTWYLISSELRWADPTERRTRPPIDELVDAEAVRDYPTVRRLMPHWPSLTANFRLEPFLTALIDGVVAQAE
ncbi:MAG: TetR/AcrR family transcriptional regulator [Gordonia sp. (in: high G+C Gram-positive bacteria)]